MTIRTTGQHISKGDATEVVVGRTVGGLARGKAPQPGDPVETVDGYKFCVAPGYGAIGQFRQ